MATGISPNDKTLVMSFLRVSRLGLSENQLCEIERILDGFQPRAKQLAISYKEAAKSLDVSSKTIERYIREGRLMKSSKGRVTASSLDRFAEVANHVARAQ